MTIIPVRSRRRGSAVLMLLSLLAFLIVIAAANHSNVSSLRRELRFMEQQQIKHWQTHSAGTNSPAPLKP
jgi:hypothetical protein